MPLHPCVSSPSCLLPGGEQRGGDSRDERGWLGQEPEPACAPGPAGEAEEGREERVAGSQAIGTGSG